MDRIPGGRFGQGTQENNLMASLMAAARNTPRGNAQQPPTPQALQNHMMLDMLMVANGGGQAPIAPQPAQNAEPAWGNSSAMRTGGQTLTQQAIQNQLMLEMLMATANGWQNPIAPRPPQNIEPARGNAPRTNLPQPPPAMTNGGQQSPTEQARQNQLILEMIMAAGNGGRGQTPNTPRPPQNAEPARGNAPPQPPPATRNGGQQPPLTEQALRDQLMLEMFMAAGNGGGGQIPNTPRPTQNSEPARGDAPPQPPPATRNGGQQPPTEQALRNKLMLDMLMAAGNGGGGQIPNTPRPAQNSEPAVSLPPGLAILDNPLVIPPKDMPLPSMDNMQLLDIRSPHLHDVLCGRGGGTNNHIGNEKFRALVQAQKVRYLKSSKSDKLQVSRDIVRAVRAQNPPGRFLNRDESSDGQYYEIGNRKAREKTSQALREGAPDIRNKISNPNALSPRVPMSSQPLLPCPSKPNQQVGRGNAFPMAAPSALLNNPRGASVEQQIAIGMQAASHFLNGKPADLNVHRVRAAQMAAVGAPANPQMAGAMAAAGAPVKMINQGAFAGFMGGRSQMLDAGNPRSAVNPKALSALPFGRGFGAENLQQDLQLPGIELGSGLSQFLTSSATDVASQSNAMRRFGLGPELLVNRRAAGGGMASVAASAGRRTSIAKTVKPSLSSLSDDLAHRLVLAETMAQRTLNGSVTEELRAEEKRMNLYLDAGLLGIDLCEMSERIAKGETEESIVQDGFGLLKLKGRKPSEKRQGATLATPAKKQKLAAPAAVKGGFTFQDKAIQDALVAIGATTPKE